MSRTLLLLLALSACATEDLATGHDEPSDFDPVTADGKADGVAAVFDANTVLDDDLFTATTAMDAVDVQAFLDDSPYGNTSWLAAATIDGRSAAEAIVDAARAENIHPLMLVARMQVESSLVSKTAIPSQAKQDHALGCGCPDGGGCSSTYRGLGKQLACGAHTLRTWFDASADGTGQWRKGKTGRTLNPRSVTPSNNATASLYAYTPWVLQGRGGTWLVWNVTKKYVQHASAKGLLH